MQRCIVLDIEGTTTPISFVTDVLFPYAHDNVRKHLELTYDTEKTQDDIVLLRAQVSQLLKTLLNEIFEVNAQAFILLLKVALCMLGWLLQ